jgi:tryptophan-rich sensory protein
MRPALWRFLLLGIGLALLLNLVGSLWTIVFGVPPESAWYRSLTLPALQPPGALFGIAWSILYALMGFAAARLLVASPSPERARALLWFAVQLLLNLAWSPVFFGAEAIFPALLLIGAVLVTATLATVAAGRVDRFAPWLLLPYLVWLGFAFGLNWRIWVLNSPAA